MEGGGAAAASDAAHHFRALQDEPIFDDGSNYLAIFVSLSFLVLLGVLVARIDRSYIQSSVVYILAGAACGGLLRVVLSGGAGTPQERLAAGIAFDDRFFFKVLLPFVVLDAGLNLEREEVDFYGNAVATLVYTFLATAFSAIMIGMGLYGIGLLWGESAFSTPDISFTNAFDSLKYGALISPTDPVAILSVLGSIGTLTDPDLFSIIFGEAVLNDSVAIVMFDVFSKFTSQEREFTGASVMLALGEFVGICFGSVAIGVAVGLIMSAIVKHWKLKGNVHYEVAFVFLMCMVSYLLGDFARMSGILTLFSTTLVASHYALFSISTSALTATDVTFRTLGWLAEAVIFFYLGIEVVLAEPDAWDFKLILALVFLGLVARIISIFGLTWMLNMCLNKRDPRTGELRTIGFKSQIVMCVAGLRGGTAYALAMRWNDDPTRVSGIETLTMGIILITLCGFGSFAGPIIGLLGLQAKPGGATDSVTEGLLESQQHKAQREPAWRESKEELDSEEGPTQYSEIMHSKWKRFDESYMKPFFGGRLSAIEKRRRKSSIH